MYQTLVGVLAPIVATLGLVVYLFNTRRPDSGPQAGLWEHHRRRVFPILDAVLAEWGLYAAYELDPGEYVGTIDAPVEDVEQMLWDAGARRNPLAAFKTLPDGRPERGSWAYRDSPLARRQLHIVLFRGETPGTTDLFAHSEYSSINPAVALEHYRGIDHSAERGEQHLAELLGDEFTTRQ